MPLSFVNSQCLIFESTEKKTNIFTVINCSDLTTDTTTTTTKLLDSSATSITFSGDVLLPLDHGQYDGFSGHLVCSIFHFVNSGPLKVNSVRFIAWWPWATPTQSQQVRWTVPSRICGKPVKSSFLIRATADDTIRRWRFGVHFLFLHTLL